MSKCSKFCIPSCFCFFTRKKNGSHYIETTLQGTDTVSHPGKGKSSSQKCRLGKGYLSSQKVYDTKQKKRWTTNRIPKDPKGKTSIIIPNGQPEGCFFWLPRCQRGIPRNCSWEVHLKIQTWSNVQEIMYANSYCSWEIDLPVPGFSGFQPS